MNAKRALAILLFLGTCSGSRAQYDKLSFEAITTKQGLSDNSVTSITQDREGFMWFGTAAGLNKYNGYNITVFRSDPKQAPNSLRNDIIWDVHDDRQGRFWISTLGDGLYQLNKSTHALTAYRLSTSPDSLYRNIFCSIHEESATVLWIGTLLGLVRFDLKTRKMRLYPLPAPNDYKLIFCIVKDQQGRLWVGTKLGLFAFDPKTGQYSAVPLTNRTGLGQPLVSALYLDNAGLLWVGTNGEALFKLGAQGEGLFTVNTRDPSLKTAVYNPGGLIRKNIALNGIISYLGDIWVATNEGLQRINLKTNNVFTYKADRFSLNTLSSSTILSLYKDRDNNLWIGTDNGVNKVTNATKHFYAYQLTPAMPSVRILDNSITAIFQDRRGTIWLGNTTNGLYQFNPYTGLIKHASAKTTNPHGLLSNRVWSIFQDSHQQLWVVTLEGLHRLDPATGKAIRYPARIPTQYITEDRRGKLWVGGKKGVASFDPSVGQYTYLDTVAWAGFNYVTDLISSRTGVLWLTHQGALQQFNPQTHEQHLYHSSLPPKAGELTDGEVSTVFEDSRGLIWIGTERGGLNCYNPATRIFSAFTMNEGLASNFIAGITEDQSGNLWVSTNKGLSRLNVGANTIRNYDATDGLPAMEFNKSSVNRSRGTLLFGGVNGFVLFNPDSIRDNPVRPPVHITGLKIRGKSRPLVNNRINLSYTENSLSFDFVALNYNAPEKNRYTYRLEGIDEDWVDSGSRRFASYTELLPGTYVFRVKAANNDGVWNTDGTSLTVVIARPWWLAWWAYLGYGLAITSAVWLISRYRSQALRQKNERLEQKVMERTQQVQEQKGEIESQRDNLAQTLTELKATQDQLIQKEKMASLGELTAGIAHEIQNPLNFVNNFADVSAEMMEDLETELNKTPVDQAYIKELADDLLQNLLRISHHGNRASATVRNMLEHSRLSTGEKQSTDLNALANEYLRLAYHGLRAKDPAFTCELLTGFDEAVGLVDLAAQDIGRTLLNLFMNAFYAVQQRNNQNVNPYHPTVNVSTLRTSHSVEIRVRDNGTGMSARVQEKIFQPFFTTKPSGEGTGLGLSLSYDIVTQAHGGRLTVESHEGEGTEFVVSLPI